MTRYRVEKYCTYVAAAFGEGESGRLWSPSAMMLGAHVYST